MANRQYEAWTLFNVRIVDMRHLWTPSTEFKGKPQDKPNYFASFITPKTQAQWHLEPALASLVQACGRLHATNPQVQDWRIEDGDLPSAEGKSSEFAKGHWLLSASSGNPIGVEIVQAGAAPAKLTSRVGVKPGDFCVIGGSSAVSQQNNRNAKHYLNGVVFSGPGEEIVFANSVSGAELMAQAEAQGFKPTGFTPSPGGFGSQPHHHTSGGFPGAGAPGFAGPASFTGQGASPFGSPQHGTLSGPQAGHTSSTTTFPSNPAAGGFSPPNTFGAPRGPFG